MRERFTAEPLIGASAQVGEGPRWNPAERRVIWVDITGRQVHLTDLDTGTDVRYPTPTMVGAAALHRDGHYLLMLQGEVSHWSPGDDPRHAVSLEPGQAARRPNDAAVDPAGRLLVGTIPIEEASGAGVLYRLQRGADPHVLLSGLDLPNGIDWSPDGRTLYFTDSMAGEVGANGYDPDTGELTGPRPAITIDDGLPDGHTVDAEGNIWVAQWSAGRIGCYHPDGKLRAIVEVPVPHVTACAFAGPELDILVITTMALPADTARGSTPHAGDLFACSVPTTGKTPHLSGL